MILDIRLLKQMSNIRIPNIKKKLISISIFGIQILKSDIKFKLQFESYILTEILNQISNQIIRFSNSCALLLGRRIKVAHNRVTSKSDFWCEAATVDGATTPTAPRIPTDGNISCQVSPFLISD